MSRRKIAGVIPGDYRKAYERGWAYSYQSQHPTLDHGDARHEPDAWYDGYLDLACGREKWHCFFCRREGGCEEHRW